METATFILNTWQRPHTLKEQVDAISKQTIKPSELMVWQNQPTDPKNAFRLLDDIENCISSIKKENGLYGTVGVVFNDIGYQSFERFGWPNPNEEKKQVDIVGHAWFFHRDLLSAFWRETRPPLNYICGEDVHFSYSIQKYLGLNTYVPPHPREELELWGSQPKTAMDYGVDTNASKKSKQRCIVQKVGKNMYTQTCR